MLLLLLLLIQIHQFLDRGFDPAHLLIRADSTSAGPQMRFLGRTFRRNQSPFWFLLMLVVAVVVGSHGHRNFTRLTLASGSRRQQTTGFDRYQRRIRTRKEKKQKRNVFLFDLSNGRF
jgi:hypothetical protein